MNELKYFTSIEHFDTYAKLMETVIPKWSTRSSRGVRYEMVVKDYRGRCWLLRWRMKPEFKDQGRSYRQVEVYTHNELRYRFIEE